jgi:asparagine synthase (glutamine-hydrolysing)
MCGIAGVIRRGGEGPPETERVRAMLSAMRHRGPDDLAVTALGAATLGNCRLAILDPVRSRQPMGDRASGCHLTFNGFIANFRELRAEMEAAGESFTTDGDTEVLLRALVLKGTAALAGLDGMFAFAFHDPRKRRTLLARDACGVKPLYLAEERDLLLFASEPKGLLAGLPGRPAPDREALLEYLSFQVPLSDRTLFRGIRRLGPGRMLEVDARGAVRESDWWCPPETADGPPDPAAAAEALREALGTSVARCLRSDAPVGAFLSGGLDSSAVAALAIRGGAKGLRLFHGAYDEGPAYDERPHARAAARDLGADLAEVVIGPKDAAEALPLLARALDEPMGGPGAIGSWFASREAARSVRVVLGGQGADELFSGYARHLVVEFGEAFRLSVDGETAPLLALLPTLGPLRGYEPLLARAFEGPTLFPPAEERFFRLVHRGGAMEGLLRADLARELASFRPRERFDAVFPGPGAGDLRGRMAEFERRTLLPALLHVEDRTSMAHGIEARVPILGRDVVDRALRTPPGARRAGGGLKPLLRAAAAPVLPKAVLARTDKMGFPVPLAPWARGPLRGWFRDLLLDGEARRRGIAEPGAVERLLGAETIEARSLWALASVELWFRAFVDR